MQTKYGHAYKRQDGYYQISSGINQGKLLHRLIYEDNYGTIPNGFSVHHIDNDKTNNAPGNLMILSKSNHHKLHFNKMHNPRWGQGRIDASGGIGFLSACKNKGMTMQEVTDELGYKSVSTVSQYCTYRNVRWNEL